MLKHLLVWTLSLSLSVAAYALEGKVIGVADGDTLTLLDRYKAQHKVRLAQIDAPETAQPFGQRSKQTLSALCFGKYAHVREKSSDRYQRVVGTVICDGVDANREMVERGMAWVYVQYAPKSSPLYGVEEGARRRRVGLWVDPSPVPPWQWRQAKRAGAPIQPERSAATLTPGAGDPVVVANARSKVYHLPLCPSYARVSPQNRVEFDSERAASAAGYRKAGNCP